MSRIRTSNLDESLPLPPLGLKPYYEDNSCAIFLGDCREILLQVDADILLTDPPYNVGKDYGVHDDAMTPGQYHDWIGSWWCLVPEKRIVFPGVGNLSLWAKYEPVATACWYKPGATGRANPFQWNEWEPILVWGCMFSCSDVFRQPISEQSDTGNHPCPKPLGLFKKIIKRLRTKGTLLDPFMGSGTTLRAAKDLSRKAIGIEIHEPYCEIAAKRLSQEVLDFSGEALK
jgi:site-specific DNA-methyltransferase (adenine-specific)